MYASVIIGGGIHGTHLAIMARARGVPADRLALVDPAEAPLALWWRRVRATGMGWLRSPIVHHLGVDPFDLLRHARGRRFGPAHLLGPYQRPSVELFRDHCETVERQAGLGPVRVQAQALRVLPEDDSVRIETNQGELQAREVVLACGSPAPEIPAWAGRLMLGRVPMWHVFDAGPEPALPAGSRVVVVGGGITAAQLALRLAANGHLPTVIARHERRVHPFDSDPEWVGPKAMRGFLAEPNLAVRRSLIQRARHRGSLPPDVADAVERALEAGLLRWEQTHVTGAVAAAGRACLSTEQGDYLADAVALATGFRRDLPGGELVRALCQDIGLPCAPCGFPKVTPDLRWHSRVRVTGGLAELELGPTARNVIGARRAAERIFG